MPAPSVSVIVVSRNRPDTLQTCLRALMQQDHPAFDLIVVADPEATALTGTWLGPTAPGVQVIAFNEANISAARNLGLRHATGDVVAFIDDDAMAEPTWLSRLTAPFNAPEVVAATGFVRGRNGLSWQWQACEVDRLGQDHPLVVAGPEIRRGTQSGAVKALGTNCAFRRTTLCGVGGFDPALRYYLDDADVSLRMGTLGATAICPDAEVLHGFAASERRRPDRVPLSLHEIAASTAVFLRRHAPDADFGQALARLAAEQQARLAHHQAAGRLDIAAAAALRESLAAGWADGMTRPLPEPSPLQSRPTAFTPIPRTGPRPGAVLAGRAWSLARLQRQARALVAQGHIATVICLSPTARPHRVRFHPDGFWLQTGGLFGPSLRGGPRLHWRRFRQRVKEETARIALTRPTN